MTSAGSRAQHGRRFVDGGLPRAARSAALLLFLLLALTACAPAKPELHLLIWSEYIDPQAVADFEKAFDCRVRIDLHEDAASMMTKLASGGDSVYDLVIPSNRTLPMLAQQGLLAPLRHEHLPNLANIDPAFLNPAFDPGNRYGAPYLWGTTGLYIRRPPGQPVEESWSLIFDPARQPGPFLLLEGVREGMSAALRYKGYSVNSTNLAELEQARDLLIDAKRRSLGFEGGIGCKNRVLARGAVLAMTWTELLGVKEDPGTYYFIPREGSAMYLDLLCIPARAPNRDLAEKFINYLLDARVGARLAETVGAATANQAALAYLNPADRTNRSVYVSEDVMRRLEFTRDLGPFNQLYDEIWTQIKSR